jgi:hypothetical protein
MQEKGRKRLQTGFSNKIFFLIFKQVQKLIQKKIEISSYTADPNKVVWTQKKKDQNFLKTKSLIIRLYI